MRFWKVRSPLNYWADFVLFPAQAVWLVCLTDVVWWQVPVGWAAWGLAEYALHRFVFHGRWRSIRAEHAHHHLHPEDYAGVSSLPTLAVTQLLFWLSLASGLASMLVGVMVGYIGYITSHTACHSRWRRFWMRRLHDVHHDQAPRRNFGVSHPLWDLVFRTYSAGR